MLRTWTHRAGCGGSRGAQRKKDINLPLKSKYQLMIKVINAFLSLREKGHFGL